MKIVSRVLLNSVLLVTSLAETNSAFAQVLDVAPVAWRSATPIYQRDLSTKDNFETIRRELLNTNAIRFIAFASGLDETDLATVEIGPWMETNDVALYQVGKSDKAFNILGRQLAGYANELRDGHSRPFLLEALTNRLHSSKVTDPDLCAILTNQPWLPVSRLRKVGSSTHTNRAGEIVSISISTTVKNRKEQTVSTTNMPTVDQIMRWVSYVAVDGEVGLSYTCEFNPSGQIVSFIAARVDVIEVDPQYASLIKSVEAEVEAEMKQQGTFGKFGSVHTFWRLKKEKLKAKGLNWHSPDELNPHAIYD